MNRVAVACSINADRKNLYQPGLQKPLHHLLLSVLFESGYAAETPSKQCDYLFLSFIFGLLAGNC